MKVRDLKDTPIKRLILVVSEDPFVLEFSRDILISRIKPKNIYKMRGDEWDLSLYRRTVLSVGILPGKSVLVIKNAESIPKKDLPHIKPTQNIHQILLSKKKLDLDLKKRNFLLAEINRLTYNTTLDTVVFIFKQKGIKIDRRDASQIYDILGRDLSNVKTEASKVACALGAGRHTAKDIADVLFPSEKGSFFGMGRDLLEGRKAEFLKKLKAARDLHLPPVYVISILAKDVERQMEKSKKAKELFAKIVDAEKDIKRGSGWERLYELAFGG